MERREPGWDLYRTFLAVLETGSLSGAARVLGLTQPTIGRHVDELEQAVGLPLFTRSRHGLAPTDAAAELRPYAEALSATAAALMRTASGRGGEVAGVVRITATEVIGVEVLPPILARLRERHPRLAIELEPTNEVEDLLRRDADVAVRMVEPLQEALVVKRIGGIPLGLHAHRSYLERHGVPKRLEELARHALIGWDRETPSIRSMSRRAPFLGRRSTFALRVDSHLAQLAAIRAGYGIGACHVAIAARDETLVRVLPRAFELEFGCWVVMHESLRSSLRCRAVFDALVEGMGAYVRGT